MAPIGTRQPTVSVVRSKADKIQKPQPVASLVSALMPGSSMPTGPKSLDASRDAWANALQTMSGVNTPDPITAAAKVAGMGLAGYGQGKATREKEQGSMAFKKRLADALMGGQADSGAIMGLMGDPYADERDQQILWNMWERNNPTPSEQLALEAAKLNNEKARYENEHAGDPSYGIEVGADGKAYYVPKKPGSGQVTEVPGFTPQPPKGDRFVDFKVGKNTYTFDTTNAEDMAQLRKLQQGIGGPAAAGQLDQNFDEGMKITGGVTGSKSVQSYDVVASTLNSMYKSLNDPSAISDLDFINGVAKILDPNSVVREAEGRLVFESQSVPSQVTGAINKILNGESALDMPTRIAMFRLAARRGDEMRALAQRDRDAYLEIARMNGIDPRYIPPMPEGLPPGVLQADLMKVYGTRPGPMPPQMAPQSAAGGQGMPSPQGGATTPAPPPPGPPAGSPAPPRDPLDLGVQQTPPGPEMGSIPPMPSEFSRAIPTPLWAEIVRSAESPQDLAEFLQEIRRDPGILQRQFPQYYGGQ